MPDLAVDTPDRARKIANAQKEGLEALAQIGAASPKKKWWAFEGSTSVDCFIATDQFHLFVEGKRMEDLSKGTDWYPKRNQLMRNLESAGTYSEEIPFGCLLMVENEIALPSKHMIQDSLPHLSALEREELMEHFLGQITWTQACEATGLNYSEVFEGYR